jgi:alpha/beta superfamily hydrolase
MKARKMEGGMKSTLALSEPETDADRTTLRSVDLRGPAGRLEALLNNGASASRFTALVCHPHPQGGGTMHNKVVYHAMKVLNAPEWGFRLPVLRFNFRGTGLSEGRHDGLAESADVVAALHWLNTEFKLPVIVMGFSFGAAMALAACCGSNFRPVPANVVHSLAALGLPTHAFGRRFSYPYFPGCNIPKLFLSGDRDQFAPAAELAKTVEGASDPKMLILVAGADHSLTGRLEAMQHAFAAWLKDQIQ